MIVTRWKTRPGGRDAALAWNNLSDMIAWEAGSLPERKTLALFRRLVKSGLIHHLQGMYEREAHRRGML